MRIQIVNNAGEVIHTKQGLELEADLAPFVAAVLPWWRPLAKRRRKQLEAELVRALDELRAETIRV